MTRYLISFDDGAMDHIPEEDALDVAKAAHQVIQEAQDWSTCPHAGRRLSGRQDSLRLPLRAGGQADPARISVAD
jgi:hypothetical protein